MTLWVTGRWHNPMRLRCLVPQVLWLYGILAAAQQPPTFRLPTEVIPAAYTADLTIVPTGDSFHGNLTIELKVLHPVQVIWLNGTNLTVETAEVWQKGQVQRTEIIAGNEDFIGFGVAKAVATGKATLRIVYAGKISTGGDGLFRRPYKGETYLLTQFEPDAARRVFPCFDEPGLKAPWRFTLHIPRDDMGLTNAAIRSQAEEPDGMKKIDFEETRPLPTYLLALAVGPFDVVEAGRAGKNHTVVRIITPKGESAGAKFAAETTPGVLEWFEGYLGLPYAFGKLDLVSNPGCSNGAMEHPGLITFCGPQLAALPGQDFPKRQRDFTRVVAHEIAHQWFGNLVTPAWWEDLWLSEGFANWLQGKYIEATKPEWNFRVEELRNRFLTMEGDGMSNTRRLHEPVNSKPEISRAFGPIAYVKGAAVLAMFDAAENGPKLRRALQRYLRQREFGTATSDDLIAAMRSAGDPQLSDAAAKFINQPGVPLVRASVRCARNKPPKVHLQQERAVSVPGTRLRAEIWDIPICFEYWTTEVNTQCAFLNSAAADVTLTKSTSCPQWVQLNVNATGYFRAGYDESEFKNVIGKGWDHLSFVDQVLVLNDLYAAVLDGSAPAAKALWAVAHVISKLPPEGTLAAIEVVKGAGTIAPSESRQGYTRYIQQTFGERARSLGWIPSPGEDPRQRSLRARLALFVATEGEDQQLQIQARELASKWLVDRSRVDSEVLGSVLVAAAHSGGSVLFNDYLEALPSTDSPREKQWLLLCLGSFQNVALEERAEGLLLEQNVTFPQWRTLMTALPARPEFVAKRFQFVKKHVDALLRGINAEERNELLAQLPSVADGACSEEMRSEVDDFFRPRLAAIPGADEGLEDVLAGITACVRRREVQASSLREYLSAP